MRPKQVILVGVGLVLLAAACAGEDTAAPTPPTTASTSTTTQPTTTVPTTTTTVATTTTMPVVTDDEEKIAYRSVQEFAEHLRQGDMEAAAGFLAPGIDFYDIDFWEWTSILEKVEFTDCRVLNETADGSEINCNWANDEDAWFSRVLGAQPDATFWAAVDTDGVLTKISSIPAPGAKQAELGFREWIHATHPEDEDRMFGPESAAFFRFSKESAELHMHYLDEYLAYLETKELDTSEPWDLVWISDSYGAGVAEAWADRIEEAEGVEVRVHNYIIGDLTIERAHSMITSAPTIREELADAEIIVVFGNPSRTAPSDVWTCATPYRSGTGSREPPEYHTSADFAPYGDVFRDVYDVIFELRAGQPTVIRVADYFAAALADWREAGIEPECTAAWEAQADAIHEAADEYGVLTAAWYDAFNGTNHDEDAREKGYIASDGWHQSQDAGVAAQVEVLHALGYEPIVP